LVGGDGIEGRLGDQLIRLYFHSRYWYELIRPGLLVASDLCLVQYLVSILPKLVPMRYPFCLTRSLQASDALMLGLDVLVAFCLADLATIFLAGFITGATWDWELVHHRGLACKAEFHGKEPMLSQSTQFPFWRVNTLWLTFTSRCHTPLIIY
jgi:hypothetical protein